MNSKVWPVPLAPPPPISISLTDTAQLRRQVDGFTLFAIGRLRRQTKPRPSRPGFCCVWTEPQAARPRGPDQPALTLSPGHKPWLSCAASSTHFRRADTQSSHRFSKCCDGAHVCKDEGGPAWGLGGATTLVVRAFGCPVAGRDKSEGASIRPMGGQALSERRPRGLDWGTGGSSTEALPSTLHAQFSVAGSTGGQSTPLQSRLLGMFLVSRRGFQTTPEYR